MTEPKSTGDVQMIAQGVVRQQAAICEARRENLEDKLASLASSTQSNSQVVDEVSKSISALSSTVTQLASTVASQSTTLSAHSEKIADHETKLAVLTVRVAIAAVVGGSLPAIAKWAFQAFQ